MQGLLFDLGGTFLRAGIAAADGSIAHRSKTRISSVADGLTAPDIWDGVLTLMLNYEARHQAVLSDSPIILSFPGPIGKKQEVKQAPTVAGSGGSCFDLPEAIRSITGRKVAVMNDMSAACWYFAERTKASRFAVVTISSGIGSKIFDRCHASGVLDEPAYAGEIAHVVVDDGCGAEICDCGGRGHLGAIASGRGIERIIRRKAVSDAEGFRRSMLAEYLDTTPENLTNERHIVPAVLERDPWTCEVVLSCTRPLIRSLLTITMANGLERIFLVGGFASALGERYLEMARELAFDLSRYSVARDCLEDLFEGVGAEQEICLEGCAAFLRLRGGTV